MLTDECVAKLGDVTGSALAFVEDETVEVEVVVAASEGVATFAGAGIETGCALFVTPVDDVVPGAGRLGLEAAILALYCAIVSPGWSV